MRRKGVEDWLLATDPHIPFQNKPLMTKFYKVVRDVQPYGFAILGDWIDLHSLSVFAEGIDLKGLTLDIEYEKGREQLDLLDSILPRGCKKVFIMGNHEDRYNSWIRRVENSKLKESKLSPREGLRLDERGYHVVEDWKNGFYVLGSHLELIHGNSTTVNAAKAHLDKFQGSVISGHTHTVQMYTTNKRGSWIIGGFFDLESKEGYSWADRAMKERWSNGFGYVMINGHGFHHVQLVQAFRNRFVFGDKLY